MDHLVSYMLCVDGVKLKWLIFSDLICQLTDEDEDMIDEHTHVVFSSLNHM